MWYSWLVLLVSCALAVADVAEGPVAEGPVTERPGADGPGAGGPGAGRPRAEGPVAEAPLAEGTVAQRPVATTRAPPRTLDRQLGELAWPSWIQNPENGNQNAPPRRITTKSLFITPLVCPKGHRLDGSACVQLLTVNKDDHERILLQELNALFTSAPNNGDVIYDYGDEDPGPLQLSIPIGIDPQQESSPQAQDSQLNYVKVDKKGEITDANVEAELELLKLQQEPYAKHNNTENGSNFLSHSLLHNLLTYSDKPKRDSPMINSTVIESNSTDEGQKELVFGHVNVDPVLYDTENQNNQDTVNEYETEKPNQHTEEQNDATTVNINTDTSNITSNSSAPTLKKDADATKLNPENDYSDIGEAIKLISRYAEVSTDDNFNKGDKTVSSSDDDSILGTRTKLQHRRNRPKLTNLLNNLPPLPIDDGVANEKAQPQNVVYYRYPWPRESSGSPRSNYPFRHLQDYWPGRSHAGGVYNTMHENPRRHHHSYPHYFHPRGYQYVGSNPGFQGSYSGPRRYPHKIDGRTSPINSRTSNQDLYSLLGLRHWFSSEGATKR